MEEERGEKKVEIEENTEKRREEGRKRQGRERRR